MTSDLTLTALHMAIRRHWPERGLIHEGFPTGADCIRPRATQARGPL